MERAFTMLSRYFSGARVTPVGPPYAVYYGMDALQASFDVGFPVPPGASGEGEVKVGATPSGERCLKALHVGPYDRLSETYQAMQKAVEAEGGEIQLSWEIYVDDPQSVAPEELRTECYFRLG